MTTYCPKGLNANCLLSGVTARCHNQLAGVRASAPPPLHSPCPCLWWLNPKYPRRIEGFLSCLPNFRILHQGRHHPLLKWIPFNCRHPFFALRSHKYQSLNGAAPVFKGGTNVEHHNPHPIASAQAGSTDPDIQPFELPYSVHSNLNQM